MIGAFETTDSIRLTAGILHLTPNVIQQIKLSADPATLSTLLVCILIESKWLLFSFVVDNSDSSDSNNESEDEQSDYELRSIDYSPGSGDKYVPNSNFFLYHFFVIENKFVQVNMFLIIRYTLGTYI